MNTQENTNIKYEIFMSWISESYEQSNVNCNRPPVHLKNMWLILTKVAITISPLNWLFINNQNI